MHASWAHRLVPVWVVATWLAGAPAHADRLPDPEPADVTGDDAAAWQLYDDAFRRLAAGDENGARAALDRIRQEFPDHPAASQAARRLAEIDAADQPAQREITDQEPSKLGRAELALNITTQSMLFAYNICEIAGCDSARANAAAYMLTGGGALALSLLLTPDGVPTAKAQLIDSTMVWGAWHSALYNSDFFASSRDEALVQMGTHLAGLGAGLGLWRVWRPTSGQVALANTGGIWSMVLTLLAHGVADEAPRIGTIVLAGDVGLLIGAALSSKVPGISRGRTLLIDAGGILGFLSGGLVALMIDADSIEGVFTPMLLGTGAGLALAAYGTRDWDVKAPSGARLGMARMGQDGWGATLSLDWK